MLLEATIKPHKYEQLVKLHFYLALMVWLFIRADCQSSQGRHTAFKAATIGTHES